MPYKAGSIVADFKLSLGNWSAGMRKIGRDTKSLRGQLKSIGTSISGVGRKLAIMSTALAAATLLVARSFTQAASTAEQYQVRLNILLGSVEEGNRMFKEMADFASRVPFEFEHIMEGATVLSGVMRNGVDEVKAWMPLIADLAVVTGFGLQTTMGQFVRMFSAGAASADLFREKGILTMLGFTAGVRVSAEDTRRQLVEMWTAAESKFRGAIEAMANTFAGQISMIKDKWFLFRIEVMESGIFEWMKKGLKAVNAFIDIHRDEMNQWIADNGRLIAKVVIATGSIIALAAAVASFTLVVYSASAAIGAFGIAISLLKLLTIKNLVLGVAAAFQALGLSASAAWLSLSAPALMVVAAIATVTAAVYAWRVVWNENLGGMRDILIRMGQTISDVFTSAWTVVKGFMESFASGWFRLVMMPLNGFNKMINIAISRYAFWQKLIETRSFAEADKAFLRAENQFDIADVITGAGEKAKDAIKGWGFLIKKGAEEAQQTIAEFMPEFKAALIKQLETDLGADLSPEGLAKMKASAWEFLTGWIPTPAEIEANAKEATEALLKELEAGMGSGVSEEMGKAAAKLADKGRAAFLSLHPVKGAIVDITETLHELKAAGLLTDVESSLLGTQTWDKMKGHGQEALSNLAIDLRELGGQAAIAGDAIVQSMSDAMEATARAKSDIILERITDDPFADLQEDINTLIASGDMTEQTQNLLGLDYWNQLKGESDATLDGMAGKLANVSAIGAAAFNKAREEQAKADKETVKWGKDLSTLGANIVAVGDSIGSKIAKKFGAAASAAGSFMQSLDAVSKGLKDIKGTGESATKAVLSGVLQMGSGIMGAVGAVATLAEAFGLFGEKAVEELKGMDAVIDDIRQASEEWTDRMAEDLLEFVKTGKLAIKDLAEYMLDEIFKISISRLVLEPAVGAFGGLIGFADGGAFKNGAVVNTPTYFASKSGTVVAGEAGTEVILPAVRMPDGTLGVRSADGGGGGNVVVNVNDHRSGGEAVQVQTTDMDGQTQVDITILDAVQRGIASGALDAAFGGSFKLQRSPG